MRFLGFLTGIALLAILYVVMTDSQTLPGSQNKLANNIREMLNNGAEKASKPAKNPVHIEKEKIDRPIQKNAPKPKKSSAPVEKQNINLPRKLAKPIPPKDKIIVLQSKAPAQSAESKMLAMSMEKPKKNNPSPQIVKVEKNTVGVKALASINNAPPKEQVQLQSFWGPFKTRISARGFAENLAKRTTIKLEIVETRQGAFMVAYPYISENERQTIATIIEQRTGLKLSDP